jgi:hypothetical protein
MRTRLALAALIVAATALVPAAAMASSPNHATKSAGVSTRGATPQKLDDPCQSGSTDHLCLQRVSPGGVFMDPDTPCWTIMQQAQPTGVGCFKPDVKDLGEVMFVRDNARDGLRVGVWWYRADGAQAGICYDDLGRYDTEKQAYPFCDLPNIPEGVRVYYKVGTCDGSVNACDRTGGAGWVWTTKGTTSQYFNYRDA